MRLACQYQRHQLHSHGIEVCLKDLQSGIPFSVQSSIIVDATGSERRVLAQQDYNKSQAIVATGIEYHVKVNPAIYQQYAKALTFFLGHYWMPQGYAWIFPMAPFQLKVGVIRYFQNKVYVPQHPSLKTYLQPLLDLVESHEILDKHGKTIYYTRGQKDVRYRGPVLAIGDTISSINPLGWEGIRHAMVSGRQAAQAIQCYLKGEVKDLSHYDKKMGNYFGRKWLYSERLMSSLFKTKKDTLIDQSVQAFNLMSNEKIMDVIFNYHFRHSLKSYFWYFMLRFKRLIQSIGLSK